MDAETSSQWRFAQCFGDKGEVDEITEGECAARLGVAGRGQDVVVCVEQSHRHCGYPIIHLHYSPFKTPFVLKTHPATADIISTVEFDHTGDYLATGDKGGRVVLFERNEQVSTLGEFFWMSRVDLVVGSGGHRWLPFVPSKRIKICKWGCPALDVGRLRQGECPALCDLFLGPGIASDTSHSPLHTPLAPRSPHRNEDASTSSTPSFNRTNQNSTISNP